MAAWRISWLVCALEKSARHEPGGAKLRRALISILRYLDARASRRTLLLRQARRGLPTWNRSATAPLPEAALGRRFCVSLENIRNRSAYAHDDSHEYGSTNPLRNADSEKHDIDKTGDPSSERHEAEMTPSTRRS